MVHDRDRQGGKPLQQHLSRADGPAIGHQRAHGVLSVTFRARDGGTALADLHQSGCLKARFARPLDGWAEAIAVNSSGGVAGGDRLEVAVTAGPGARVVATAQAAERFYRALEPNAPAAVRASLRVEAGAALDWLPQEAILFDGVALDRSLDVEVAGDARFLGVETLLFGRAAMGEQVRHGRLRDRIVVRRSGRMVLRDAIRLDGDMAATLDRSAVAGGARAVATLVYVSPDAADLLDPLRAALAGSVEAGASCWDGMVVARLLARDGAALRGAVVAALSVLREHRTLPRSWNL